MVSKAVVSSAPPFCARVAKDLWGIWKKSGCLEDAEPRRMEEAWWEL